MYMLCWCGGDLSPMVGVSTSLNSCTYTRKHSWNATYLDEKYYACDADLCRSEINKNPKSESNIRLIHFVAEVQ